MPVNHPFFYESVFGVSDQVSVSVVTTPSLVTVSVKEFLTGNLVEGATVEIMGVGFREVGTTGADGSVTLTVTGGTRTIIVSKSGYWTKTGDRLISEDTTIDVSLIPIWMIVAGGLGAGGIILVLLGALRR